MRVVVAALAALGLAACGGDEPGDNPMIDAAVQMDAASKVVALATCPSSVAATMTTGATAFSPSASTVSVGGVVKLTTTVGHNVIPNTLVSTDSALMVGQNATKCFQFNAAGTYGIACGFHGFAGTITVQ
jgi:plastocyanin